MNTTHDKRHVAILSRFVTDQVLDPVLDLKCDKCMSFIDYVTVIDKDGDLSTKPKKDLDENTFKLLLLGKMDN